MKELRRCAICDDDIADVGVDDEGIRLAALLVTLTLVNSFPVLPYGLDSQT
jgi:hypothetical protein